MTGGFGEVDLWLAQAGRHEQIYEKLGAHLVEGGVRFAVWAPNARSVSVVGDFNDWDPAASPLQLLGGSGIWEGLVDGAEEGHHYKFNIDGRDKADPYAFRAEVPPQNASIVFESRHVWQDAAWIEARRAQVATDVAYADAALEYWRARAAIDTLLAGRLVRLKERRE